MSRKEIIYSIIGIIIFIIAIILITNRVFASQDKDNLCHKTGSESNPWVVQQVNANEVQSHLDNGDFYYEGPLKDNGHPDNQNGKDKQWCKDNQPEQPTVTPTVTPTPTNQPECDEDCVSPTPTPTIQPSCEELQNCEPSITPEPTREPEQPQAGSSGSLNDHPEVSQPVCTFTIAPALLQGFERVSATSVKFSWWKSNDAEQQAIIYGYSADNMPYSQLNIGDTTSFTINDLQANTNVFAKIRTYKGACNVDSNIVDP